MNQVNKDPSQMTIEDEIDKSNCQILLKGIWTGILISLIVLQLINQ